LAIGGFSAGGVDGVVGAEDCASAAIADTLKSVAAPKRRKGFIVLVWLSYLQLR
jgi:hypothetical protein